MPFPPKPAVTEPRAVKETRVIERVGYIGIGNIGETIAANVRSAGYDLMVYDLRPEPLERMHALGAKVAMSASELAAHSELLEVSIAGDDRIEDALTGANGLLREMTAGSIVALHSTMHPATVRRIAASAVERGVHVIDAQVSGGRQGAQERRLCYMVGGKRQTFDRCHPVFATSGSAIFHMGPLGTGASTKLAQQMITVMNLVAVAEGLRVAEASGVDRSAFLELLAVSTAQSYAATHWSDEFYGIDSDVRDGFYLGLRPALAMAHDINVQAPGTALAQQLIRDALQPLDER